MVSTPKAPSATATAQAQSQYNTNTAITQQLLNMTNQDTPYGSVSYDQTGTQSFVGADGKTYTLPKFTQTTTLNPEQQSTLGYTQDAANNIAQTANSLSNDGLSALSQPVDISGAPSLQTNPGSNYTSSLGNDYSTALGNNYSTSLGDGYTTSLGDNYNTNIGNGYTTSLGPDYNTSFGTDTSTEYNNAKNAVMDQLTPTLDRNAEATRAQELASGVRAGSAAYSANEQTIGDNYTRAANQATLTAQSVENQLFNQQEQQAAYTDNALLNQANFTNSAALNQAQFGNSAALNAAQFGNDATLNQFNSQNNAALNQFNSQNNAALNSAQFTNNADLNSANFNNDARSQYLSQYYQQRDQALNELSALLSGSQVTNATTGTTSTPQTNVAGVDYSGLVQNEYEAKLQNANNTMSGLFGIGSGLAGIGGTALGSSLSSEKLPIGSSPDWSF
ncbi:hypothetical protein NBRC3280_2279 [Acetobacter pasteurianus NBRC 3280]|uniref:Uncharacterized protein n=1 Tax=Acetobacter pasteurianus NBRC 3278 TaxID=1226660 RepID=A0A401X6B2_ACEPA|nr:hypothetical protein [Acetobacter pasteurianus]GCD59763.1 hypothetical protein NBRC3277_2338 [Acetobacter pasteurianus NBRC 3277]GCD63273.1 hypothetical protein NBRC3278_2366 [Acetobacter pasteurianus NBRC 3278]GCD69644.1 hypothetical protein NBRC3280_2279 [Acetobacter pasteurianus NBRC 3280]